LAHSLLEVGDDLDRSKARQRLSYMRHHPAQLAFFRRVAASGMPLSVRRAGLWNDLQQFARLPVCPLERISCPTLVVHGRADGNVPLAHAEFVAVTVPDAELFGAGRLRAYHLDRAQGGTRRGESAGLPHSTPTPGGEPTQAIGPAPEIRAEQNADRRRMPG
jgi:fermentation-respiration switch protein FrsA (DUF1100 family)